MRTVGLALAGVGLVAIGAWGYRRWWLTSVRTQFVKLTAKRRAAFFDEERH